MEKGDIYWAKDRENHPHAIVFLESIDDVRFKGCILSSRAINENLLILPSYFMEQNNVGIKFEFPNKQTYLVTSDAFIKMDYWVDNQMIIGKLTEDGIAFIEKNIPEQPLLCVAPIWKLRPPNDHKC